MSDNTIFNGETPPPQDNLPNTPTIPTGLEEFVGEGKKWASVDEAVKSVPHAQKHIQTLEKEALELKAELAKRKSAEDILDEIKSGISQEGTTSKVEIDPDIVAKIAEKVFSAKESQQKAVNNVSKVANAFRETFGDKAEEIYNKAATESGLSVAQMNQLAASSPEAVLKLGGITVKPKEGSPAKLEGSNSNFNNKTTEPASARVVGRSTKDIVSAWQRAGEKIKQQG